MPTLKELLSQKKELEKQLSTENKQLKNRQEIFKQIQNKDLKLSDQDNKLRVNISEKYDPEVWVGKLKKYKILNFQETLKTEGFKLAYPMVLTIDAGTNKNFTIDDTDDVKTISIDKINFQIYNPDYNIITNLAGNKIINFKTDSDLQRIIGKPDYIINTESWYHLDEFRDKNHTKDILSQKIEITELELSSRNNQIEILNQAIKNLGDYIGKEKTLNIEENLKPLKENLEANLFLEIITIKDSGNKDYTKEKAAKTAKLISKLPIAKIQELTAEEVNNIKNFDEPKLTKLLELVEDAENKKKLKTGDAANNLINIYKNNLQKEAEEKAKKQKQTIELQNLKSFKPDPTDKNRVVLWKEDGTNKNPNPGWYTINDLDKNPNTIFLFGDNVTSKYRDSGTARGGGQAIVTRGEIKYDRCEDIGDNFKNNPFKHGNAYGISTTTLGEISDVDFRKLMDIEFAPLEEFVKNGGKIVVPCQADGKHNLGKGLGEIKNDNNKLQIIQNKIDSLIKTGQQNASSNQAEKNLKKVLHTQLKQDIELYHKNENLSDFIKNKQSDTSILVSMCTIDRIDGFLKDFPKKNDEPNSECRSSTLINSNIRITLFNEDGGNKIGIVIDPKRSKIQHGEFFAYGTGAMVPEEIKKDKANLYHDGYTEQLSSKYSEKTGRIGRWTGMEFFATNYAKWDIGKEKDGKYTNKQWQEEGSLEIFNKALNREYYYYKDNTEKKYKKKGPNELKEMRYNEVLVQQSEDENPVNGIIINVSSMLKSPDKGKISPEEQLKLLKIFQNNNGFKLHIYDRRNKGNQIIILNNTEAQNLLSHNSKELNEELISFSNHDKKESFSLVQPYIKLVDRIARDIYKIEYGQYQKINNQAPNGVSLVGVGIGKDSGATYIQVKIKNEFFEISAGDELRIRKAKEIKGQVIGRSDNSKANIVAEGKNLISGKNKTEIENFLQKEGIKNLFDNLEKELTKQVKSNTEKLYQIYNPNFRPPVWSIKSCEDEDLSETTKIYCDEGANKDEVMRLATEREPVNMAMSRYYDENALQQNFGYKTSAYQNIYSQTGKTPANIAIYTKTSVKWGGKETTANIINVIAPALDSKNQPDYEIFFDTKKYPITFREDLYAQHMESVFNKIFQAAIDNGKKEIILSGFGLGFFSSLCPKGAAQDGYKTGLKNSLKKFESNLSSIGIKISYNSYEANNNFADEVMSLTRNLRGQRIIGGIDEIVFKQNNETRLYVNAWDPHSFVGNGNAGDDTLDGWWGRMTAMGFLCSPLTNKRLLETDKIKFVTNINQEKIEKDNLQNVLEENQIVAVGELENIVDEELSKLKQENNNLLKEKKITEIPSDNFLKEEAKDNIIAKLIRQEILDFQEYMAKDEATATNRVKIRENLGKIVSKVSDRVSEFIQGSAQQDATEFLEPIFENLFANNITSVSTITIKDNPDLYNIPKSQTEILPLPKIEFPTENNAVNFSAMIEAFNKEESLIKTGNLDKYDNRYEATKKGDLTKEKVNANKKLTLNIPKDLNELVFVTKRFNKTSKITRDVNFDPQTFNGKKYEITAFILHGGTISGGHYTTYIKEEDGHWYCYDDSQRRKVNADDLEKAKKQAYVVKYSAAGTSLPPHQNAGTTGGNNRCWMNASLAFLGSLTSISRDNLLNKDQSETLRNEILGNKKGKKEEPVKKEAVTDKLKNSTIFQSSDKNQNDITDETKALEEITQKTVIDPNLRAVFLDYLNEGNNFFEEIGKNSHPLYNKKLKWNNLTPTNDNEVDPLIKKFTKEFVKQYLIFLFQKYDGCGVNFADKPIDTILTKNFSTNKNIIKSFNDVEQNYIQGTIISSLIEETNKTSKEFENKLQKFTQLVYDFYEGESGKEIKEKIAELQKKLNKKPDKKDKKEFPINDLNNSSNKKKETYTPDTTKINIKEEPQTTTKEKEVSIDDLFRFLLITPNLSATKLQSLPVKEEDKKLLEKIQGPLLEIVAKEKYTPNPITPYLGCGFKFDVSQDSNGEISMKINEIFSPELKRFFNPNNNAFLSDEELKSLDTLDIKDLTLPDGSKVNLTQLFKDNQPKEQFLEKLAAMLHDSGNITFEAKDNQGNIKEFGCSRNKQTVFVTNECPSPEAKKYFTNRNNITGAAYNSSEHGFGTPESINAWLGKSKEQKKLDILPEFTLDTSDSVDKQSSNKSTKKNQLQNNKNNGSEEEKIDTKKEIKNIERIRNNNGNEILSKKFQEDLCEEIKSIKLKNPIESHGDRDISDNYPCIKKYFDLYKENEQNLVTKFSTEGLKNNDWGNPIMYSHNLENYYNEVLQTNIVKLMNSYRIGNFLLLSPETIYHEPGILFINNEDKIEEYLITSNYNNNIGKDFQKDHAKKIREVKNGNNEEIKIEGSAIIELHHDGNCHLWIDCAYIGIQNYIKQNKLDHGTPEEIERNQKEFFEFLKKGKIKKRDENGKLTDELLEGDTAKNEFQTYYPGYIKDVNPPFDILRARFLTKFLRTDFCEIKTLEEEFAIPKLLHMYTTCIIALDKDIGKNLSSIYDMKKLEQLKNECESELAKLLTPNSSIHITNQGDINNKIEERSRRSSISSIPK